MSNFAFFLGIDWADKKHDIAVVTDQGKLENLKVIEHSTEAVEASLADLLSRAQVAVSRAPAGTRPMRRANAPELAAVALPVVASTGKPSREPLRESV